MIETFLLRYVLNFAFTFIVIRLIYYPTYRNKDFVFTYFLFNNILFVLCFLLSEADLKFGFAFGLFALFSMFRYRTVTVPIGEMGYFFLVVTLGIINSISSFNNLSLLLLANGTLVALTFFLGRYLTLQHENAIQINFEDLNLLKPEDRNTLIKLLEERTGLKIHKIQVMKVDFQKQIAQLKVYYFSNSNESFLSETED